MRLTDKQRLEVEYNMGKFEGRREVVDCLINDFYFRPVEGSEHYRTWQAKLKEWGLDNG